MNGFVLFYMAAMDDMPIAIYETFEEAQAAARLLEPEDCKLAAKSATIMRRDFSVTSGAAIAEFRDGMLAGWVVVRMFDEEGCCE